MSVTEQYVEEEQFRVLLVLPWSQQVLTEKRGRTRGLPRINIPKWTRSAQRLREEIQEKWGIRSFIVDFLSPLEELPRCTVVEVRSRDRAFDPSELMPVCVDDLDEEELTQTERIAVKKIIDGDTQECGPFSKLGWIDEARSWIRENVLDHDVTFNEDVRQLSAGGAFALVRFGTVQGPAYWLKATAAPNAHEFTVTQTIARHCSRFVPPLIATRLDWNAWVSEDAGEPLYAALNLPSFEQATHCLAQMQLLSVSHVGELQAAGCFDLRLPTLREHIPALVGYLEVAMARQTSTKVAPLTSRQLHELGGVLNEASIAMEALALPETLIHNDMNSGNILFDGVRIVFTDWSEACIGCPFLTFQHLLVQALEADETRTWAPRLKEIYKSHWRTHLSESQIERVFALSPSLAIASYLCGRDPCFASPHRSADSVQSYTRSLARHMSQFAQSPEFLEALCR